LSWFRRPGAARTACSLRFGEAVPAMNLGVRVNRLGGWFGAALNGCHPIQQPTLAPITYCPPPPPPGQCRSGPRPGRWFRAGRPPRTGPAPDGRARHAGGAAPLVGRVPLQDQPGPRHRPDGAPAAGTAAGRPPAVAQAAPVPAIASPLHFCPSPSSFPFTPSLSYSQPRPPRPTGREPRPRLVPRLQKKNNHPRTRP